MVKLNDIDNGETLSIYTKTNTIVSNIIIGLLIVILAHMVGVIGDLSSSLAIGATVIMVVGTLIWLYGRITLLAVNIGSNGGTIISNMSNAIVNDITQSIN